MSNVAYRRQAQGELQCVHDMVRGLGEMDSLVLFLRQMAVHYAQEDVIPGYIDIFEKALLALMEESFPGSEFDEELWAAWAEAVSLVKSVLVPALVQARKEANVIKTVSTCVCV